MNQGLCSGCGAAVKWTGGQNETKCEFCDTVVTIRNAEALLSELKTAKFAGILLIAETSQEGGNYGEAIEYYNKIIEQQPDFADAWLNKGICQLATSTIGNLKIPEAISCWKAAIKFAKHPDEMKKRVALEINNTVVDFYPTLENHYLEFHTTSNALSEHFSRFKLLESAQAMALELNPTNVGIAKVGLQLCDRVVKSIREAASASSASAAATLLSKNLDGAVANAVTSANKYSAAQKIEFQLIEIKTRYVNALERILGSTDAEVTAVKAELDKKEKQSHEQHASDNVKQEFKKHKLGRFLTVGSFGCAGIVFWAVATMSSLIAVVVFLSVFGIKESDVDGVGYRFVLLIASIWPTLLMVIMRFKIKNDIRTRLESESKSRAGRQ